MKAMSTSHFTNRLLLALFVIFTLFPGIHVQAYDLLDPEDIQASKSGADLDTLVKGLPEDASLDLFTLILVNADNPAESNFDIPLAVSYEGLYYHEDIGQPVAQLREAGLEAGYEYQLVSAYRTIEDQAAIFEARYHSYLQAGYSDEEAYSATSLFVADPNATEHLTGLAIDLLGYDYQEYGRDLHQVYGQYGSAIWLAENAWRFGFILRYPEDKIHITGIEYEPWHFRYVGPDSAAYMHKHGLVLEEYLALIHYRDQGSPDSL